MELQQILQTANELHKILSLFRPQEEHKEANKHFTAWYLLVANTHGSDMDAGIIHKLVEKYIESRETPMHDDQRTIMQEMLDEISNRGEAEPYVIK